MTLTQYLIAVVTLYFASLGLLYGLGIDKWFISGINLGTIILVFITLSKT